MTRRLAVALLLTSLLHLAACGDGAEGPAGPQGPAGAVGPPGSPGTAGPAGSAGAAGQAGAKGETGSAGPTGPTGPKGDTGDTGASADAGTPRPGSCLAIKNADAAAADGVYAIELAGLQLQTTCNMADGGWTMIASLRPGKVAALGYEIVNGVHGGRYMPETAVRQLAAASSQIRFVQTSAPANYFESVAETTPILQLRKLMLLQDDATMATSSANWTANGTMNLNQLNYTCPTTSRNRYPDLYWACGNGTGTHLLPLDGNVRLGTPSVDVDVYVK